MVILGGAAGGFVTALVCPFLGCDHVLDDIRIDILKCLALAGYLILGFWGVVAGIRVIVESVHGPGAPLFPFSRHHDCVLVYVLLSGEGPVDG